MTHFLPPTQILRSV